MVTNFFSPIFRNHSGNAYRKDTLGDDFHDVREAIGKKGTRQLADMHRSGTVKGDAGGGSVTDQSNEMANTVAANNRAAQDLQPIQRRERGGASMKCRSRERSFWNKPDEKCHSVGACDTLGWNAAAPSH